MAISEAAQHTMPLTGDALGPSRPAPIRRLRRDDALAIQRDRLLAATVTAVAQDGYTRLTAGRIIAGSRVSRNTFYGIFKSCEDCFCASFTALADQARTVAREAYEREAGWHDGVRSALAALLDLMDDEPGPAKVCVVDSLAGGEAILECRANVLAELAAVIDGGRALVTDKRDIPAGTAEGVVAGIAGLIHAHLVGGREEPLAGLLGQLMYMIVLPYLGRREAAAELESASPGVVRRRPSTSNGLASPLDGLSMRLTYRTVRVLSVISGYPGANNREVAIEAGVLDQGQISKLLHRLKRLELIENREVRRGANSWHLTRLGAELPADHQAREPGMSVAGRGS